MTFEEFTTVKFYDALYINGVRKIRVMDTATSPSSEHFGTVMWYDDDEYAHRTHYDKLEFQLSEFEVEADRLAHKYFPDSYENRESFKIGYRIGYKKAKEE